MGVVNDGGVHRMDHREITMLEVCAESTAGLGLVDERRDWCLETCAGSRNPFVPSMGVDNEVFQGAIGREQFRHAFEQADESCPRVRVRQRRLGERRQFGDALLEQIIDQRVLVRVAPVDSADADSGRGGDVIQRRVESPFGEQIARCGEDPLAVTLGIATQRPIRPLPGLRSEDM